MNVAAEPLSRAKIRTITWKIRELAGFDHMLYFPIVHFIEWVLANPENEMGLEFEIVEPDELGNTYGTTNTARNKMIIRSDVYDRAVKGNARDRFTLCHELGHYLLHQPEAISLARGRVPVYRDPEWQANTFAAELMAPARLIKDFSVDRIVEECGMSWQAANIQYNEIHR